MPDLEAIEIQNDNMQADEEQYSDDFETIEKQKETNLVIEEKTKLLVEQSSSAALTLSAIKLDEMTTEQQTDEILKLINFDALVHNDLSTLLSSVICRQWNL